MKNLPSFKNDKNSKKSLNQVSVNSTEPFSQTAVILKARKLQICNSACTKTMRDKYVWYDAIIVQCTNLRPFLQPFSPLLQFFDRGLGRLIVYTSLCTIHIFAFMRCHCMKARRNTYEAWISARPNCSTCVPTMRVRWLIPKIFQKCRFETFLSVWMGWRTFEIRQNHNFAWFPTQTSSHSYDF